MASIADVYVTVLPETGKIADGIEKALRNVDVKAIAETWKAKIEQVLKGTEAEIQIKVDGAKAKAEIEKTAKDHKAKVEVETKGAAKAEAELDAVARERTAKIKVDYDKGIGNKGILALAANMTSQGFTAVEQGAKAGSSALDGMSNSFKETSSSASRMGTVMAPAIAGLIPLLTSLAGVAAAASGALLLLPAAFAAVGAGAGVLMVGLSGITDAYEAVSGAAKSAGKDAQAHASKVQSASRSVASAQQSLTSAVRSEKQAQNDVARARRDALHELQDINDELRNGAIDETQANLDLAKARQELATGTFDSSLDYQQAQLNVIKAEQRAKEAHEQNAQTQQDANDKQQKGVEGADAVVAANERLADAQQNVANAQQAAIDAQTRLAEANNETSTSAQKAADAMGLLAPAGQDFVNALMQLTPVWNQFKQDLQQPLLAGLGETLTTTVNAVLPAITPGLQRIAGAFNTMFKEVGEWLQKPENLAMIEGIINNIATAFENLGPAVQPFLTAITTLVSTGSGFLPELATGLANAANSFANFITQAQQSGELDKFIQTGLDTIGKLGEIMPHVVSLFEKLVPLGVTFTPILVELVNKFLDMFGSLTDLWTILEQISPVLQMTLPFAFDLISTAVSGVVNVLKFLIDGFNFVKDLVTNIADVLNGVLAIAIDWVKDKIGDMWKAITDKFPIIGQFVHMHEDMWNKIKGFWEGFKIYMGTFFEWVKEKFLSWIPEPVKALIKRVWPEWGSHDTTAPAPANAGLPVAAPGQVNRVQPPVGPTPALPPGSPAPGEPGGPPAVPVPTSSAADGTRVFVTNWPAGGIGGGGTSTVTTTAAPGASPTTTAGAPPIIPDPNRPGFFTSSNPEWAKLIKRESGGNPTIPQGDIGDVNNATGDLAMGLFQITGATWRSHGGEEFAPSADQATPQEQAIVAGRIFAERGGQPWGATPGGGREDEAALRAGLSPGTSPTAPSPAAPQGPSPSSPPGTQPTTAVPGEQVGTTAGRLAINAAAGLNEGSGWRTPDGFDEHSGGNAVDFMVGTDKAKGDKVLALALQNPNVDYALWQQRQWNADGSSTPMEDRHNPTANHMDHVHVHFKSTGYAAGNEPGATGKARGGNAAPAPSTPDPNAGITGSPGTNPNVGPIQLDPNVPLDQQGNKDKGKGYGQQLGQDIISGMMEVFGLGDVFPDPTQFGLFKIFKSLLAVKPGSGGANGGPTNAANGSGTGDPLMDLLGAIVPNANGTGGILGAWAPPGSPASGQGAGAPPGPVDNSMTVNVQGDAGPKALDTMDTQHVSTIRNTAPGG